MFLSSKFRQEKCRSADPSKVRLRINRESTQPLCPDNLRLSCQKKDHNGESQIQKQLFKQQMKQIIAENAQYFQHKIQVTDKVKPNQYRFKIPTTTGKTLYKRQFRKKAKNASVDNLKLNSNTFCSSKIYGKFEGKTTYQNEFRASKGEKRKTLAKSSSWVEQDAPRFLETQNKCDFLNWGGRNVITSMKPTHQAAVTNAPFQGKTAYRSDFQTKGLQLVKSIIPESSMSKFTSSMMIKQSCYASQFINKENRNRDSGCKPKEALVKGKNPFKGSTEYREEFLRDRTNQTKQKGQFCEKERTLAELQTLIIDL